MTKGQAVLGTRGEHPVGFLDLLGDQVVDQHADVGVLAREDHLFLAADVAGRVQPGHQPLGRRFLVARGAVDLARGEEARDPLGLKRRVELRGGKVIVLDRVAGLEHRDVAQARHGAEHRELDVLGEAARHALDVPLIGVEPFGLQKDRVKVLVREAEDLVLDAGAVARADALDHAGEHRGAVEPGLDHLVGLGIGLREVAGHLRDRLLRRQEREVQAAILAGSECDLVEGDATAVDAGRGAGLEAAGREAHLNEAVGEGHGGSFAGASPRRAGEAGEELATQEGSGGQDGGAGFDRRAVGAAQEHAAVGRGLHAFDQGLVDGQVCLVGEHVLHGERVLLLVGLGAQGLDSGTLGRVEDLDLDGGAVGDPGHLASEGVDLTDQVALGGAADGGVARHRSDGLA
ncbi:hypothetical protein D3C86_487170 [compost metagenome]